VVVSDQKYKDLVSFPNWSQNQKSFLTSSSSNHQGERRGRGGVNGFVRVVPLFHVNGRQLRDLYDKFIYLFYH